MHAATTVFHIHLLCFSPFIFLSYSLSIFSKIHVQILPQLLKRGLVKQQLVRLLVLHPGHGAPGNAAQAGDGNIGKGTLHQPLCVTKSAVHLLDIQTSSPSPPGSESHLFSRRWWWAQKMAQILGRFPIDRLLPVHQIVSFPSPLMRKLVN